MADAIIGFTETTLLITAKFCWAVTLAGCIAAGVG